MGPRHRRVIWSEGATVELDAAIGYVAEDAPSSAARLLERVLDAAASLADLSGRGRVVPERQDPTIRELLVEPFRLLYKVRDTEVIVLGLIHQRQDYGRWRDSRP